MTILSDNIRRLRADRGMSQAALSRAIGVTSLKMIETGRVSSPRYSTLQAIARALGVTVADLYAEPKKSERERRRQHSTAHSSKRISNRPQQAGGETTHSQGCAEVDGAGVDYVD